MLGVGYATVSRVLRLHRETAAVTPRPRGGGNFSPLHGEVAKLLEKLVREMPDATVKELADALAARSSVTTSRSAVQRALARLGYSRKKVVRCLGARHAGAPRAAPRFLRPPRVNEAQQPRLHRRVVRQNRDEEGVRSLAPRRARDWNTSVSFVEDSHAHRCHPPRSTSEAHDSPRLRERTHLPSFHEATPPSVAARR